MTTVASRRRNNTKDILLRNILPRVYRLDELPQWITSSDKAAFHPAGNAIYIRKDQCTRVLLHEYAHWAAWMLNCNWFHQWLDGKQ